MSPAEVLSIVVDEDAGSMDIAVAEEKLSQAIGRGGQNVRLASELTGWILNVMDEKQAEAKTEEEAKELQTTFMEQLDVDAEVAVILIQEGFSNIDEVAYISREELLGIEEFDDAMVDELQNRARDSLLTKAIASEESIDKKQPAPELLQMEGMDQELAYVLAGRGILTLDDLGEQSVDELMEVEGMDEQRAAVLIMKAREHWFAEDAAAIKISG
jgi:N utilization substance protein A